MKKHLPFFLVFTVIICFYAGNIVHETPRSAHFFVDTCTMGFINKLKDYHAAVQSFCTSGHIPVIWDNFPPAYQVESAVLIHLFGKHWVLMTLLHNGFYLALLLVGMYLLGTYLANRKAGILAMFVVALYPLTYAAFDKYSLDFPLMAIATLCLYALLRSELFLDRRWSVIFGIGCSYGMLMKEPFGVFVIGPVLWAAVRTVQDAYRGKTARLLNILVAGGIVAAILFGVTRYYRTSFVFKTFYRLTSEPSGNPVLSFENLRFFIVDLWEGALGLPFFLLLAAGIWPFVKRVKTDARAVIALWIVVPLTILFFMPHWKTVRYMLPGLPAFALISAVMLGSLSSRYVVYGIVTVLASVGILQYYLIKNMVQCRQELKVCGITYFRTGDVTLSSSLTYLGTSSRSLERTGDAVLSVLKRSGRSRHRILYIARDGDWTDMQGLLGPYLWYVHDLDVQVLTSETVWNDFVTGSNALDAVDSVVYALPQAGTPVSLGPDLLRSIWVKQGWMPASDLLAGTRQADSRAAFEKKWGDFIGSFRYQGIIENNQCFVIHMYTRV